MVVYCGTGSHFITRTGDNRVLIRYPYENGTVNLYCGWGSAINIDDVQHIVLGGLVLWEAEISHKLKLPASPSLRGGLFAAV